MDNFLQLHNVTFANPWMFLLLLGIPLLIYFRVYNNKRKQPNVAISSINALNNVSTPWQIRYRFILTILKVLAYIGFVITLARPQLMNVDEQINSEGIDIVISLDISGSMLAEDFAPNRIGAAKATAATFIQKRIGDRIGLVVFAGESFTQCPITIDKSVLLSQIDKINSGLLVDGTAIGMGLATAVDRLKDAKGKSRVVVLLTDGINNAGLIDPMTALEVAKAYNVKVYTVGVGTKGEALYPVTTQFGTEKRKMPVQIDEDLLQKISTETGGQYYRATDNKSLEKIYKEIDQLEKTNVEVSAYKRYQELYWTFLMLAFIALSLEFILARTVFKYLP